MNTRFKLFLFACLAIVNLMVSAAPTCQKTGSVCTDANTTRTISGVSVTRACWNYQDTYQCVAPNALDYCTPLVQAGCTQSASVCNARAFNGDCLRFTNTYQCGSSQSAPTNTVTLNNSYTLVKDIVDTTQCAANINNPNCTQAEHVCTTAGGTRIINGLPVTKDCWGWTDKYVCAQPSVLDTCSNLQSRADCSLTSTTCADGKANGDPTCNYFEKNYSCTTANSSTTVDCSTQKFCIDGNCNDAPAQGKDTGLGQVAALLKTAQNLSNTDNPAYDQIFKGTNRQCETGYSVIGPLKSCCNTGSGGIGQISDNLLCNADEKQLDQDRVAGTQSYVGSYCSNWLSFFGSHVACLATKESYCVFGSKLGRIIQQQGRPQLGIGWGSPESPNCTGMTADDLKRLDFSKMDLGEFAADVKAKALDPAKINALTTKIQGNPVNQPTTNGH